MGIYSEEYNDDLFGLDKNALIEAFLIDDLTHNYSEDTIKEFCAEGGIGEALVEAKVLSSKRTLVRLSKESDLERRKVASAIMMAKSKNDPLYNKLIKYNMLRKQTRAKIMSKYGTKAAHVAVQGQKEYIKTMKNVNLSNSGSGAFITADPNR